jgi:hypothetical protein
MRRRTAIAAAVGTLIAAPAAARANEVFFRAFSPPGLPRDCTEWRAVRSHGGPSKQAAEAWVFGYATALNIFWDDRGHGTEYQLAEDQLLSEIDAQCAKYPKAAVDSITTDVLHEHIGAAQKVGEPGAERTYPAPP